MILILLLIRIAVGCGEFNFADEFTTSPSVGTAPWNGSWRGNYAAQDISQSTIATVLNFSLEGISGNTMYMPYITVPVGARWNVFFFSRPILPLTGIATILPESSWINATMTFTGFTFTFLKSQTDDSTFCTPFVEPAGLTTPGGANAFIQFGIPDFQGVVRYAGYDGFPLVCTYETSTCDINCLANDSAPMSTTIYPTNPQIAVGSVYDMQIAFGFASNITGAIGPNVFVGNASRSYIYGLAVEIMYSNCTYVSAPTVSDSDSGNLSTTAIIVVCVLCGVVGVFIFGVIFLAFGKKPPRRMK